MNKIVFAKIARPRDGKPVAVREERAAGSRDSGTLLALDAHSSSFGQDLRYVFGRNVAKARRENKRLTGSADLALKR